MNDFQVLEYTPGPAAPLAPGNSFPLTLLWPDIWSQLQWAALRSHLRYGLSLQPVEVTTK
jgi:hypothetical protein